MRILVEERECPGPWCFYLVSVRLELAKTKKFYYFIAFKILRFVVKYQRNWK